MTDNNHPITPPQELAQQWYDNMGPDPGPFESFDIAAARWGADQELEACCEWLQQRHHYTPFNQLRAARRPKPPSLKEQAEAGLNLLIALIPTEGARRMAEPIRLALESLPD